MTCLPLRRLWRRTHISAIAGVVVAGVPSLLAAQRVTTVTIEAGRAWPTGRTTIKQTSGQCGGIVLDVGSRKSYLGLRLEAIRLTLGGRRDSSFLGGIAAYPVITIHGARVGPSLAFSPAPSSAFLLHAAVGLEHTRTADIEYCPPGSSCQVFGEPDRTDVSVVGGITYRLTVQRFQLRAALQKWSQPTSHSVEEGARGATHVVIGIGTWLGR